MSPSPGPFALDHPTYLRHLAEESRRFRDVLASSDLDAPVPSCPDWDARALLDHLTGVQWHWGTVVRERITEDGELEPPPFPQEREALLSAYDDASAALQAALRDTDPATEVWMWSEDKRVGFIARRQALEAAVHRMDAELAAGVPVTPVEPALAADGVLEVLDVMYGGCPPWGSFEPQGPSLVVRCTDTGDEVPVVLGRFTGTSPDGTTYDEPDLSVRSASLETEASAVVSGAADDLLAWLWKRRGGEAVTLSGDETTIDAFTSLLGAIT
jgi:uncharacterized protein (TIGR03083 family)